MSRRRPGGGWADFAAVILLIAGFLNAAQGLSALFKKAYFVEEGLLYRNLRLWAVVWLVLGLCQIGTASLLFGREPAGRILGVVFAAGSAVVSFLSMGAYPVWHLTVIGIDLLIIFGLMAHPEAYEGSGEEAKPDRTGGVERPVVPPSVPQY
jgi:hypothetical protein